MKRPVRICVKCGDRLRGQRTHHQSSKEIKTRWGWSRWCDGPHRTPGGYKAITKAPIHFRDFAGPNSTICGKQAGLTKGRYKSETAEVPWSRIKVNLSQTTCPECLVLVIQRCKKWLHEVAKRGSLPGIIRQAHGQQQMSALRKLVNT